MTTLTVQTTPAVSLNGYKVGDQVKWADPDNKCKWGVCYGVVMNGTQDYNLGQFVVFWHNTCTRHQQCKHTESDDITRTHVKIAFAI
jgi:hypothetical protein